MLKRYFKNWLSLGCKVYHCFLAFEDDNKPTAFVNDMQKREDKKYMYVNVYIFACMG